MLKKVISCELALITWFLAIALFHTSNDGETIGGRNPLFFGCFGSETYDIFFELVQKSAWISNWLKEKILWKKIKWFRVQFDQ